MKYRIGIIVVVVLAGLACGGGETDSPRRKGKGRSASPQKSALSCCEVYDAELGHKAYTWIRDDAACRETSGVPAAAARCESDEPPWICCEIYDAELGRNGFNWIEDNEACANVEGKVTDPASCPPLRR